MGAMKDFQIEELEKEQERYCEECGELLTQEEIDSGLGVCAGCC